MITFTQDIKTSKVEVVVKSQDITMEELLDHFRLFCLSIGYSPDLVAEYFEERLQ
jgi:hypothetical protein